MHSTTGYPIPPFATDPPLHMLTCQLAGPVDKAQFGLVVDHVLNALPAYCALPMPSQLNWHYCSIGI